MACFYNISRQLRRNLRVHQKPLFLMNSISYSGIIKRKNAGIVQPHYNLHDAHPSSFDGSLSNYTIIFSEKRQHFLWCEHVFRSYMPLFFIVNTHQLIRLKPKPRYGLIINNWQRTSNLWLNIYVKAVIPDLKARIYLRARDFTECCAFTMLYFSSDPFDRNPCSWILQRPITARKFQTFRATIGSTFQHVGRNSTAVGFIFRWLKEKRIIACKPGMLRSQLMLVFYSTRR